MDRSSTINAVAADLHASEKAIDDAIIQATTLVQTMIGSRMALSVSPIAGAVSQAKAVEMITALSAARDAVVACHTELAKDHRRMGYGTYSVGPLDKPSDPADYGDGPRKPTVTNGQDSITRRHLKAV